VIPSLPAVTMDEVIANSFRNYHVKGFDYICIKRSPLETVKLYFFDGDVSKLPEVVAPHDHRYDFKTYVLAGGSQNMWFKECRQHEGEIFERFAYETPLNGGEGFMHVGQTRLKMESRGTYRPGQCYSMKYNELHTIRMVHNETVLCLIQKEDRVGDRPTLTFMRGSEPPNLNGMYTKFSADQVMTRVNNLLERCPTLQLPRII
jgi:hypothetical protein